MITRSSSAIFPAAVIKQYPGVIDGMVFVSPSFPGEPEIIAQEVAAARKNVTCGVYGGVNEAGIAWIEQMLHQVDWGDAEDFCGVSTLILTATQDIEVVDQARVHFKKLANRLSNVTYHEFNSACHDFLSCEDASRRDEALRSLQLIQDMFKRIVNQCHYTVIERETSAA